VPDRVCVVADSQALHRSALAALVRKQPGFQVVAEAGSVAEAVGACRRNPSALLILDTRLPGSDKTPAVRTVASLCPDTRILALVGDRGQHCLLPPATQAVPGNNGGLPCCGRLDCIGQAIVDGAHCVLPRSASARSLFRALRCLAVDQPHLPVETLRRMSECLASRLAIDPAQVLTRRERQIATLIAHGRCNKEIGEKLQIRITTVKKHVGRILAKMNLHDRLQLGLLVTRDEPFSDSSAAPTDSPETPRMPAPPQD